jgi:tyrosyl-tRNA synthetase
MPLDFVEELRWRGLVHNITPGTEEALRAGTMTGYAGFDPTAPSLQVGNLVAIMLLVYFQRCGHKPIALVGGATGMIGDPSGKSEERNLLSADEIRHNQECIHRQLQKFLDFGSGPRSAEIVNNYDWFKDMSFLEFMRDIGKHLTVSYMMAKDSVQNRLESGLSFTEFSYQLLQGYDFYWLYANKHCRFQMGGSDQWGNITAGCELVRRKANGEAYALVCPLLTKADGTKFGKSAAGERLWLDGSMTSPYKFYQFWLNATDADAPKYLRIFSTMSKAEISAIEAEHAKAPHLRIMQMALAKEVTTRVHSESDYQEAVKRSELNFGGGTLEALKEMSEEQFLETYRDYDSFSLVRQELDAGVGVLDFLTGTSKICPSKSEAKRLIENGGISINKVKIADVAHRITADGLINGRYILVQKGKKNHYLGILAR